MYWSDFFGVTAAVSLFVYCALMLVTDSYWFGTWERDYKWIPRTGRIIVNAISIGVIVSFVVFVLGVGGCVYHSGADNRDLLNKEKEYNIANCRVTIEGKEFHPALVYTSKYGGLRAMVLADGTAVTLGGGMAQGCLLR